MGQSGDIQCVSCRALATTLEIWYHKEIPNVTRCLLAKHVSLIYTDHKMCEILGSRAGFG